MHQGAQKLKALDPLELELWAAVLQQVWVLGTEFGFSERAVSILNRWAISPVLVNSFKKNVF